MSVTVLIEDFVNWPKCVVEVTDIASAIVRRGFVHSIDFVPFEEDPRDLLGMLVRWESRYSYGTTTEHVAVCYNVNVEPWMRRLICSKELVHVPENGDAKTNTPEAVKALLDSLFPSDPNRVVLDIFRRQAQHENYALYQATNLMFPAAHRTKYQSQIESGALSLEQVAAKFDVPVFVAETILSQEWKAGESGTLGFF
jgi:hypothetical protein